MGETGGRGEVLEGGPCGFVHAEKGLGDGPQVMMENRRTGGVNPAAKSSLPRQPEGPCPVLQEGADWWIVPGLSEQGMARQDHQLH